MRLSQPCMTILAMCAIAPASASIVPTVDGRMVHVQGSVGYIAGEPVFEFESHGADGFVPWNESASVALELPGVVFDGFSTQDSQIGSSLISAAGTASLTLAAAPGSATGGTACSHFVMSFDVVQTATIAMSGTLFAADAPGGAPDSYALATIENVATGDFVVGEMTQEGVLLLDMQVVLDAGTYEMKVESHCLGSLFDGPGGTSNASFDVDLTVAGEKCPDHDGDGSVGIGDLLSLLADWGDPWAIGDLLEMLAAWGPCP